MTMNLNTKLADCLRDVVRSIDAEFIDSPPMIFVTYFKNFDIDYHFNSTEELPAFLRNKVLFGK